MAGKLAKEKIMSQSTSLRMSDSVERRPVVGYEGLYEVSSDGRVFGVDRVIRTRHSTQRTKTIRGKELPLRKASGGYVSVSLSRDGKSRHHSVHRLVLMAFAGEPLACQTDGNHKNGVRTDNRIENLEWVTRSENHVHKFRVLCSRHSMTGKFDSDHHRSIGVVASDPKTGEVRLRFGSMMGAHRAGYQSSKISNCISGKRKTHAGLVWSVDNAKDLRCS